MKAVNNSSSKELQEFLKLDSASSAKIKLLKKRGNFKSYDELKSNLGESQIVLTQKRLEALTPIERQYLVAAPQDKNQVRALIMRSDSMTN